MSEPILTSKKGTTRCTMQIAPRDGHWGVQVKFEGEGVDWFTVNWNTRDLAEHIAGLQKMLDAALTLNKANP